jgi:tetratricopeptide (TPR) repeat protein
MSNAATSPLPADPARQADAMLRACEYQILQTVSAWLDLRGNDVLYVEGAEDFDRHSSNAAEAVQIKTSPQPISLGQKEVQETLNNYWKLRRIAAGSSVRMRFLTCAPYTVERGSPFGAGIAGLEVWQRRPLSDGEARQIADFLAQFERLESDFRRWLERATPSQIRSELVECVIWQTYAEEAHFIERGIHNKLAAFGAQRGAVPASVTRQVAQRLIEEVWKTLRKSAPRRLDFFLIEELWEEVTMVSISRSAFNARLNESRARPATPLIPPVELLLKGIPPLPGTVTQRVEHVGKWRTTLSAKGLLNLHGSTRTGKTTLAKLIASTDADTWKWWSAARMKPEELQRALPMLALEVARSPDAINIVLDDLDFSPAAAKGMEKTLGELLAIVEGRRGRALITSQKPLPRRLQHAFGTEADQIVAVPRLDDEEVTELAIALGCTDEKRCSGWARLVRASTGGHPQLAAVRLLALKQQGWPVISVETFDSGVDAIEAEKADARQLMDSLPQPQQEYLQRLSVFPVAFRRDHAVVLGAKPPPLASPGNIFDSLVGPWVEPLHGGYFALSPLLADGARAALPPANFQKLQNQAAMALLTTEPRTTTEGSNAFFLFWQTRNGGMLFQLLKGWTDMEEPIFSRLAEDLWWFTYFATVPGQCLFEENPSLSLGLRWFQFRIAMSVSSENAALIVESWRWELAHGSIPEAALQRMILAGFVLPCNRVQLPAAVVVDLLKDVSDAAKAHPELPWPHNLQRGEIEELAYLPQWDDVVSTLSFLSSIRCASVAYLDEFLTALENIEQDLRSRILRGFVGSGIEAQMALDRVWIAESESAIPDWPRCLEVLDRALKLGRTWKCPSLSAAAMRGISVVLDECVKDHRAAHEALNGMAAVGDLPSYAVHDRRACIYFSEGNYVAAEEGWRLALADWPQQTAPFDMGAAFAARSAGISAARQERWLQAADWFQQIIERLTNKSETHFVAGAYADAGYCLWKAGKPCDAIVSLIEAWRLADTLPLGRENLRAFTTRKTIGHVIAWLNGKATQGGVVNLHEPLAGTCSSAEVPEQMREQPETESANVWIFLMRLEREFGVGHRAAELGKHSLEAATDAATRSVASMEFISQNLFAGCVANLPADIIALAQVVQTAAASYPEHLAIVTTRVAPEVFEKNDAIRGASVFLAGLVTAHAQGHEWRETVMDWRASLPSDADYSWIEWFSTVERVLGGTLADSALLVRRPGDDWAGSMLAAWNLLLSDETSPDDMFFAHARWLGAIGVSPWLRQTVEAFCIQAEAVWTRATLAPALLRHPRLNVPAILAACVSGNRGLARAARILLAAYPTVNVRMPSEMETTFRNLAELPEKS